VASLVHRFAATVRILLAKQLLERNGGNLILD
jgi:hypothetical protein